MNITIETIAVNPLHRTIIDLRSIATDHDLSTEERLQKGNERIGRFGEDASKIYEHLSDAGLRADNDRGKLLDAIRSEIHCALSNGSPTEYWEQIERYLCQLPSCLR